MSLTTDDLIHMTVEIITKKPPSLRTPEAEEVRKKLRAEIEAIHAAGGTVEIPTEVAGD